MERYTRPRAYGGIILIILLVAALQAAGLLSRILDPVATVVHRITGTTYAAGTAVRTRVEDVINDGTGNTDELAKTVDQLRIENARLRTLADENASLKAALGYQEELDSPAATARVISESADDAHNAIVIDRGSEDGIEPGLPVIAEDGILVGKVISATRRTASVLLLSDSKSAVAVAVQNAEGTLGVLEGDRGLSMAITLIPQTEHLIPGDIVVTSGIETGIPRGLVIGTIDKVTRNTQDPFQSATVVPLSAAAHPTFVSVLLMRDADEAPSDPS